LAWRKSDLFIKQGEIVLTRVQMIAPKKAKAFSETVVGHIRKSLLLP
jgi:hypothetical protein